MKSMNIRQKSQKERSSLPKTAKNIVVLHPKSPNRLCHKNSLISKSGRRPLSEENAQALMLKVHHSGKAIVGTYTYDLAVSKAQKATSMAREKGYPLRLTVEPEE